jgi:hypothetical protein
MIELTRTANYSDFIYSTSDLKVFIKAVIQAFDKVFIKTLNLRKKIFYKTRLLMIYLKLTI